MDWQKATDVRSEIKKICQDLELSYIDYDRVICFRSYGSTSSARARIWSFPKVWQLALNIAPHYVIEVLSKHYDKLSTDDKKKVLIHELMHIPKNFSGSLLSHRGRGRRIDSRNVEQLFRKLKNKD